MGEHHPMWLLSAVLLVVLSSVTSELTPPYFNLGEGRKITASSTCGKDIDGPELYCKLVGSHTDDQQNNTLFDFHDDHFHTEALARQGHVVIQGQVRSSLIYSSIHETERWWRNLRKTKIIKIFKNWFMKLEFFEMFSKFFLSPSFWCLIMVDDLLAFKPNINEKWTPLPIDKNYSSPSSLSNATIVLETLIR